MGLKELSMVEFSKDDFLLGLLGRPLKTSMYHGKLSEQHIAASSLLAVKLFLDLELAHELVPGLSFPSFLDNGYGGSTSSVDDLVNYMSSNFRGKKKKQQLEFLKYNSDFWNKAKTIAQPEPDEDATVLDKIKFEGYPNPLRFEDVRLAYQWTEQYLSEVKGVSNEMLYAFDNNRVTLTESVNNATLTRRIYELYNLVDVSLLHLKALSRVPNVTTDDLVHLFSLIDNQIEDYNTYGHKKTYFDAKHMFGKID